MQKNEFYNTMKPRVWIVSELFYPEDTSTGYFLTGIGEGLAKSFSVSVLCAQPTYSERGKKAPSEEIFHGIKIRRVPSTTLNKDFLLLRLINIITISFSLFLFSLLNFRPKDFVLVVTNPPLIPFLVQIACGIRGARSVLLVHDVYPDVFVATGWLSANSFLVKVFSVFQKWLLKKQDGIIVLGRDMKKLIGTKIPEGGVAK